MPPLAKSASNPQRQPPPSLFLGPPSRDSSRVSLPAALPGATHTANASGQSSSAYQRPPSLRGGPPSLNPSARIAEVNDSPAHSIRAGRSLPREQQQQQQQEEIASQQQVDRTETLWAEMQLTLDEVELSAASETHVFGAEHAKALEELRTAQVGLARAWARNEEDETDEATSPPAATDPVSTSSDGTSRPDGRPDKTPPAPEAREEVAEDETEHDFLLARRRREANDRYFERVNGGVLDVVARLEEVAAAMRTVEQESRDLWSDSGGDSRSTSIS